MNLVATASSQTKRYLKKGTFAEQMFTFLDVNSVAGVSEMTASAIVRSASALKPLELPLQRGVDFLSPSQAAVLKERMVMLIEMTYCKARYHRRTIGLELAAFAINGLGYKYGSLSTLVDRLDKDFPGSKGYVISMCKHCPKAPDPRYGGPSSAH